MRLKPDRFNYLINDDPYVEPQRSLVKIGSAFARVYRLSRHDQHVAGPSAQRLDRYTRDHSPLTFLLVHGIGLSATYMLPLAERLSRYGQVFLVDLPGFGDLPAPEKALTIGDFAEILSEVLDINGIDHPILVGHSMGAQIVVEMLASHPQNFQRAALIGPPVFNQERSPGWVIARYSQSSIWERPSLIHIALWSYVRAATVWMARIMPRVLSYPIEERISQAHPDAHIVFIRGEHDYLAPVQWLEFLAHKVGRSKIVTIPGAAHSTLYNDDREVSRHIISLIPGTES
ncbi:alpha/beta fold hydrolase [Arcanobacterium phocisimile]|uniref:Alpha/beta fold hydrolase n=1 Tax=Arcanobacterium phocisimile TaxID=1302235 RepID=A0ABX7IH12_9ACTO|nr:alpha/beta fold hydrolase [Arcanobacterium phocisimile]QRV01854.1 alpha/beta fold hydrolase [Arcanobacterium phocisimile]